jgi:hypothetical protein
LSSEKAIAGRDQLMPTLDFKGKQHIYAHHLTVPYRPLVPDPAKSAPPADYSANVLIVDAAGPASQRASEP